MKSPFKFLDSYTKDDRAIFFGRDQEITDLYRKVFESKILLVYGVSGTGKSSLINCGLASRFDESDWLPVNVRRGNNIIESLDDAIKKQTISPLKKNLTISEKIQSIYLDHFKPVFLVFDQFEELFIFGTHDEREDFIRLIKEIVRSKVQCRIILVIREEFLAGITEFEEMLPEIFSNRFRVEKMKRGNAILAVEGPCKVHDIKIEIGFSEELVDKLIPSGQEIELTFLQIYLDRIFRIAESEKQGEEPITFSKDLLLKAGSVSDLLGQFLEEQIRELDDPETGMSILKSFVSLHGTKKQMTEPEIMEAVKAFGTEIAEPDLVRILNKFVDLRILRERDEAGHFELRHDALAEKIYEKFTAIEKDIIEVRHFIENAYQTFKTRKICLTRDDLEYLGPYEKRLYLSPELGQFVKQSWEKLEAQQRALKRLTRIVAVIFIILVGIGVRYYIKQKSTQHTREDTVFALLQERTDPLTSINTAFTIREKDPPPSLIKGIILRSFYTLLNEKIMSGDSAIPSELLPLTIPVRDSITAFAMNKSGTCLFGWTLGNEIFLYNIVDKHISTFITNGQILSVEISDDGEYIAAIYSNSLGEVFKNNGEKIFNYQTSTNHLMNKRLVRFFNHGKFFMAAVKNDMAEVYDSTGRIIYNLEGHKGSVNSLDISPDGRFIATASSDKQVRIWNFNHTLLKYTTYSIIKGHLDTVWSCEFNKTGKYIITASADSMIRICDLNGYQTEKVLSFGTNTRSSLNSVLFLVPGPITDSKNKYLWADTSLNLDSYNKKICDARFASDDRAIISSNYSYDKPGIEKHKGIFRTQVIYFGDSYNRNNIYDFFLTKARDKYFKWPQQYVKLWEISKDRQLFAAVQDNNKTIVLTMANGYEMLSLSGAYPVFSSDCRYLYYITGKKLERMILDLDEIRSFVFEKRLFGDPESGKQLWLLL